MPDYLPEADAAFMTWVENFEAYVAAHAGSLPFSAEDRARLAGVAAGLAAARDALYAARVAFDVAVEGKDDARRACEGVVRSLAWRVRVDPAVSDAQRVAMGIPVRRRARHKIPLPEDRPAAAVRAIEPLAHRLRVAEPGDGPPARKPDGVVGAEVWMTLAAAPGAAPSEPRYVGLATDGWFVARHDPRDAGKRAAYRLRWVNTRGQRGPFGPEASATIAA
jgi:hypothetical protein